MRAGSTALALWLAAGGLLLAPPPAAAQKQPAPKPLRLDGELSADDVKDRVRTNSYCKLHVYRMEAGRTYRIDMISNEIDPFLRLEDPFASARHARVFEQGNIVVIEDLGSTNGTYLNEELLESPRPLHPGDRVRIGDSEFAFEVD